MKFNELCKLCTCRVVITEKSKTQIQREKVDIGIHWMDSITWPQSVADSSWAYGYPQIGPAFELIPVHPWWLSQASILGAVAGAHLVRHVAPAYGVPAGEPRFSPLIGSCKQLEMWYFGFVHWCSLLFRHWQRWRGVRPSQVEDLPRSPLSATTCCNNQFSWVIILCSVAGSFLNGWLLDCSRVSTRSDDLGRLSMMSVTINVQSCPISDLGLCALRPLRKEVVALVRWHVGSRRGESCANHVKELAKVGWIGQLFLSIFCNVCCSGVCRLRKHLSLICRWIFMQPTLSLRDIPPNHFQLILGILGWNALHNTVVEVAPPSLDSKMLRSGSPAVLRIPPLSEYSSIIFFQNEHFSREDGVWTDRLSSRPMASHSFPLTCWTCLRNRYGSVALGVISCQYDFCIFSTTCHQFPPFPTGSK